MRIAKIEKDSLNNGPGIRAVVWCQGCSIKCPGCHNKETWNPFGGVELTERHIDDLMYYLKKDHVSGITFSGGHPLEWYNIEYVIGLIQMIRKECPDKDIWIYTGWILDYSDIADTRDDVGVCLTMCDVVVDGPFVEDLRDVTLAFRGSSNQRIIDIKKTLKEQHIVLWEEQ